MSKLYISSFEENRIIRWGLFYEDAKGVQHLTEDFKPVTYDTEEQAKSKLAVIEAERQSEDSAIPFSFEEAKLFVESHKWKYATTYAKTAPHEYLVKPKGGYPGLWWFKYGIRDVGHALESLKDRGFIQWAPKTGNLGGMKADELKQILVNEGLPTNGKKAELIDRIVQNIPEDKLIIPNYTPKYELTELGKIELEENGYVPYMHKHNHLTTEDGRFGETFTVWDINKLFPDGNAKNWRKVVGEIEKKRFGVDMANALPMDTKKQKDKKVNYIEQRDEVRAYLASKKSEIDSGIRTTGDGFDEESQGLDLKATGRDKEALVKFYISIGKRFDAPALYREAAVLLRKYGMYEEELSVINAGLLNIPKNNGHRDELFERKKKVQELIKKEANQGRKN